MRWLFRTIGLAAVVAAAIGLSPRVASACSCMPGGPPCQAYFQADVVFVGTVRSITVRKVPLEGIDVVVDRRVVRLSIERAARGVQGTEVDVTTGSGGGDCGYNFKIGERYVVYAYRNKDGALGTSICSRTRPIADASDDLAYFSALPASGSGARVFGTVKQWERDTATDRTIEFPVADVQVLVRGSAGVFSGVTGDDGRYVITGVAPGTYETEVLPPPEFSTRYLSRTFEIKDPRACQQSDFGLQYAGRVSGVVLDAAGRPAADVRVEIARAASPDDPLLLESSRSKTDANGQFELADVQPGSYVVGVGLTMQMDPDVVYARTLYPDSIDVGKGNRVEIGTLRLPQPSRRHELKGVAVDSAGTPLAGATVVLHAGRRQAINPVRTAADGSFTVPVFEQQFYTVRAYINVSANPFRQAQATQTIAISGDPPPIRLVLVVR
jgi:Carboxypeptidase regulatory-like domain